jgi:chorismate mutase
VSYSPGREMPAPGEDIDDLRRAIDDIDRRILELVAARVRVVLAVGDYKRARGLAVYDPERERSLLAKLASLAPEPLDGDTVRRIFERLIDESRRLEQHHVQRK